MSDISIIPGELNIECYKGDTLYKLLTLTDGNGDPLDLSTATVAMQIRRKAGEDILLSLTEGSGLTVSTNTVLIDSLIDLDKGNYKYDIQFVYASGLVRTYIAGTFSVPDDITRT